MKTLQLGDVIDMPAEGKHIVWFVNESRAAVAPIGSSGIKFKARGDGKASEFVALRDTINIAPTSLSPILYRLGERGLLRWVNGEAVERIHRSQNAKPMSAKLKSWRDEDENVNTCSQKTEHTN